MRRRTLALAAVFVLVALTATGLSACGLLTQKKATPPSRPVAKVGVPSVGVHATGTFFPLEMAALTRGSVAVGTELNKGAFAALDWPLGGSKWGTEILDKTRRLPADAVELRGVLLVAGSNLVTGAPGSPEHPFAAVSADGGPWAISDLSEPMFKGASAPVAAVGLNGEPSAADTEFLVVGAASKSPDGEVGNPMNTIPFVLRSKDGRTWSRSSDLPLPDGVLGAEAVAVAYAPSTTAFPGVLLVGNGAAADKVLGRRTVVVLWQSTDGGETWKVISDDNFNEDGRLMEAQMLAASGATIVVAGTADTQAQAGKTDLKRQRESVEWVAGSDGVWHVISDGSSLKPDRSSRCIVVIARPTGGFLTAGVVHNKATGFPVPGSDLSKYDASVQVFSSVDGLSWAHVEDAFPGLDKAAIPNGMAESRGRVVISGLDGNSAGTLWVGDSAAIK